MRLALWLLIYSPALLLAVPAFAWAVAVWAVTRHKRLRKHTPAAVQPLIGWDQLLSAMTGGDPDETVSSRLGKSRARCLLCAGLCRVLDWLDPGHCDNAIEHDRGQRMEETR